MKAFHKKAVLMLAAALLSLLVLGAFLMSLQTGLSLSKQRQDTEEKLSQVRELLLDAEKEKESTTETFDEIYRSKASSLAYMLQEEIDPVLTGTVMEQYRKLLNVNNILILDREGNVLAEAKKSPADFTRPRFNQLRTAFSGAGPSEAFEVDFGTERFRYYGARVDAANLAVVEQDPAELKQLLSDTSTLKSVLSNVSIGLNGFAFAVSNKDYSILNFPDETKEGMDALDAGLKVEELEDGYSDFMSLYGERYYCGIAATDDAYVICAVPAGEILSARNITVGIVLFIFFIVMTVVISYALFMLRDEAKKDQTEEACFLHIFGLRWNRVIGRKICTISAVGLIFIFAVSFYMQTLFAMSRQSMSSSQRTEEVADTIDRYQKDVELLTERYNRSYLSKAQTAAYIIGRKPELADRAALERLSTAIGAEFTGVFDAAGNTAATSSPFANFTLSEDPEDQSYEFRKLLQGVDYVVQKAQPDEVSGESRQYIGAVLRNGEGVPEGFVQIAVQPEMLEAAVNNLNLSSILDGIRVGTNGFAFAVNKETHTFDYYPKENYIGRNALEAGMTERQLQDGYCDYLKLGQKRYYGSSVETDEDYVYVVVPEEELEGARLPVSLSSLCMSFLCLLVICLLLGFELPEGKKAKRASKQQRAAASTLRTAKAAQGSLGVPSESAGLHAGSEEENDQMIDVVMPDGSVKKTVSATSRWDNLSIRWAHRTPEQQVMGILKGLVALLALLICVGVLFGNRIFDETSVFRYVIAGGWERGVNVFALTGSIMIVCLIGVGTMLVREVLRLLSKVFDARGETICRLISSFLKYISVIAALYYCFALFGVDTKTLLASAGILTLVIGLGAKELVSDILAGLFIIFEGEFRVGDIVTIGDWRGTVQEIGVRTTKIMDAGQNIKIFSNSAVSGVINMTKQYSYVSCDVGIEYGESLERVEAILDTELPKIGERLSAIKDGPYYKGVVSLGDSSVVIRIVAQCAEADRAQLGRDLNREMKLLCDRHDINIPFPQIVLNQPPEFKEATAKQKRIAEEFNEEQKELTKDFAETGR